MITEKNGKRTTDMIIGGAPPQCSPAAQRDIAELLWSTDSPALGYRKIASKLEGFNLIAKWQEN